MMKFTTLLLFVGGAAFADARAAIHLKFADSQCHEILDTDLTFPASTNKIDKMVQSFLKGSQIVARQNRFSYPDQKLQALYLGHRLRKGTLTLRFKKDAFSIFNSTACQQTINRVPLEKMFLEMKTVRKIRFEVGGKLIDGWDA